MSIQNLTTLKSELDNWSKRTLGSQVNQFIALAEKRIVRALAKNGMQNKLIAADTRTAAATMSLPAGVRSIEAVYLDTNPKQVINYMPPQAFFSRWLSSETGKPKAYTIQGNIMHLGPSPDTTYSVKIWFRQDLNITRTLDQLLIPEQTHDDYDNSPTTEGTFAGGTGHANGDVITLASGAAKVEVTSNAGGVVDGFVITDIDHTDLVDAGETLSQSATTGSGVSFSLTLDQDNISNLVLLDYPELYLYGALIETFTYYRNDKEFQRYVQLFADAIDDIEEEAFNLGPPMQIYNPSASAGAPRLSR